MGFSSTHKVIREALKLAHKRSKVVFAAAGGYGFNQRRCYPASSPHVIGIHAVDGRGKDCGISAAPVKGDYNFSALGVCANSFWGGVEKKFISGSAYATAIAAGIAASLLHFVRLNLELEHAEDWEWLRLISTEIDGYRCIMPSLFGHDSTTEDICKTIMMVVRKNRMSRGSRNVHY
jgi:hypothetical protein